MLKIEDSGVVDIDRDKFVNWLTKQPADKSWDMNDGTCCMLSAFMTKTLKKRVVMYGTGSFEVSKHGYRVESCEMHMCPDWAQKFQSKVLHNDFRRETVVRGMGILYEHPLTAKEALLLLATV